MEGDFEMAAGAPMGITHEELEEIDSESHFCLLCHFCSDVNRGEVAAGVNQDIHQLVEFAAEFRSKYSLEVTAGLLHDYYITHLKDMEEYRNFPEWTKKTVYKHLLTHTTPKTSHDALDLAYTTMVECLLLCRKQLKEKDTGLLNQTTFKSACMCVDRIVKCAPPKTTGKRKSPEDT